MYFITRVDDGLRTYIHSMCQSHNVTFCTFAIKISIIYMFSIQTAFVPLMPGLFVVKRYQSKNVQQQNKPVQILRADFQTQPAESFREFQSIPECFRMFQCIPEACCIEEPQPGGSPHSYSSPSTFPQPVAVTDAVSSSPSPPRPGLP